MDETLDILPGEGEVKTTIQKCCRRECDVCGELAHFKQTFLLKGARQNPASSAYGKDDCSWCEDGHRYVCKTHKQDRTPPPGMVLCSIYPANERFKHLFLFWRDVK